MKISVAMATYNGERFLREQLDSLLCQVCLPFELVVCDDLSTDSTVSIVKEFSCIAPFDVRIFTNSKNLGYLKNFEQVISLCRGDYIALSDQDDIWDHNKLAILSRSINGALLIHSDAIVIDAAGRIVSDSYFKYSNKYIECNFKRYVFGNNVTGCTTLFKADLVKKIIPIHKNFVFHDWWIALHAAYFGRIVYVSRPLVKYRQHLNNISGPNIPKSRCVISPIEVRDSFYLKRKLQLASLLEGSQFDESHSLLITDLLRYYDEYFKKSIRIWSFIYHVKNYKYFSDSNFFLVNFASLVASLFGRSLYIKFLKFINKF